MFSYKGVQKWHHFGNLLCVPRYKRPNSFHFSITVPFISIMLLFILLTGQDEVDVSNFDILKATTCWLQSSF